MRKQGQCHIAYCSSSRCNKATNLQLTESQITSNDAMAYELLKWDYKKVKIIE